MNFRTILGGLFLGLFAAGFLWFSQHELAGKSSDPAELMRIVWTISGTLAGLGAALVLMGLFGLGFKKKR